MKKQNKKTVKETTVKQGYFLVLKIGLPSDKTIEQDVDILSKLVVASLEIAVNDVPGITLNHSIKYETEPVSIPILESKNG